MLRVSSVLFLAATLASCAQAQIAPSPVTAAAGASVGRILAIQANALRIEPERKRVVFSPGGHVKSASYTHYLFDHDEFMKAVGGRKDAILRVLELGRSERRFTPPQGVSAPLGGYLIIEVTCRIVGAPR